MTEDAIELNPRVFISYSWTDEEHIEWVCDLGKALASHGIEVVLDQWSLKEGQDVTKFMESMVTDETIKRVIIVSDSSYANKADGRNGGVGTETQILSIDVYRDVDQTKVIAILKERDANGKECLPKYLEGRKYIDFSNPDYYERSLDDLVRNVYERPRKVKPPLGRKPIYLEDEPLKQFSSAYKSNRLREILTSGRGNAKLALSDFTEDFVSDLKSLRLTYTRNDSGDWCDVILNAIDISLPLREIFVDVIQACCLSQRSEELEEFILPFMESILPFVNWPEGTSHHFECSEDNFRFLCYEFMLYLVSILVKNRRFITVRRLIDHVYVIPGRVDGNRLESRGITSFNDNPSSLDGECAEHDGSRYLSHTAKLIKDRATRLDIHFRDLLQADVLLFLASTDWGWYPRTLVYSNSYGSLELFLRASSEEGFKPLSIILKLENIQALVELVRSDRIRRVIDSSILWQAGVHINETLNLRNLHSESPK